MRIGCLAGRMYRDHSEPISLGLVKYLTHERLWAKKCTEYFDLSGMSRYKYVIEYGVYASVCKLDQDVVVLAGTTFNNLVLLLKRLP